MAFTESQSRAIEAEGKSLLVSAAAGSGKTTVLVERLMRRVTEEAAPQDLSAFLIITYTRAAASELRERISAELSRRLAENPARRHLRRQSALVRSAPIGTIHSFCTSILREKAALVGLSPDFRVLEQQRSEALKAKVLETVLENAYEKIGEDAELRLLVDTAGAGRDDARLGQILLDLYSAMQTHPYPQDWLRKQEAPVEAADVGETVWGRELLQEARQTAAYWEERMEAALAVMQKEESGKLLAAWGDSFSLTAAGLRDFLRASEKSWDEARRFAEIPFPTLKAARGVNGEEKELAKAIRESCKKYYESNHTFFSDSATLLETQKQAFAPMRALIQLTLAFDAAFQKEKERLNLLDFSDLEHKTIELLVEKESGAPTPAAKEISARYAEIMIDEFQDVNAVQNMIFRALSREEKNLFMVGDVKQSIYRFRLADPGIFLDTYRRYAEGDETGELVLLRENFRSRTEIIEPLNAIFRSLMSRELGDVEYDEDAALRAKAEYPSASDVRVSMVVTDLGTSEEDEPESKTVYEAHRIAALLREKKESGETVWDKGVSRPMRWSDVAILMRSPNTNGEVWRRVLAAENIPVSGGSGEFFRTVEISVAMSLLAIVDNPRQDVALISVLRSPLFGFTADELAAIRAAAPGEEFYSALCRYAEENEKCADFLKLLQELRLAAEQMSAPAFTEHAFVRTGLYAVFSAMPDGAARRRRLTLLSDMARSFEENGYKGLYSFVRYLREKAERGEPISQPVAAGDCVTLTSIHKSKGLEFPIVVLADTAHQFNKKDLLRPVLIHPELGLGPKFTDTRRGLEYPTLSRMAITRRLIAEMLSEEMRVLYVALTRAKERLIVSCVWADAEKTKAKLAFSPVCPEVLRSDSGLSHWLARAFWANNLPFSVVPAALPTSHAAELLEELPLPEAGEEQMQKIRENLAFRYPYAGAVSLPSKLTATGLQADGAVDADAQPLIEETPSSVPCVRPDFYSAREGLTPAERGTALHLVMQHIRYECCTSEAEIRAELERLQREAFLTPEQVAAVSVQPILRFFRSPLGCRVLAADRVLRETRFSLLCEASEYFPEAPAGEKILMQGVVDCCIEEVGKLTIIDYKTDYVNLGTIADRAAHYAPQLQTYAMAMERMTKKPVQGCLLWFFRQNSAVEIPIKP